MFNKYLLPNKVRTIGLLLLLIVFLIIILKVFLHYDFNFLNTNVFALVTGGIFGFEFFKIIKQNLIYPLSFILSILGVTLIAASQEKNEKPEYSVIRAESILLTFHIVLGLLVFSFIFIYDFALLYLIICFLFLPQIIYYLVFKTKKRKFDKNNNS